MRTAMCVLTFATGVADNGVLSNSGGSCHASQPYRHRDLLCVVPRCLQLPTGRVEGSVEVGHDDAAGFFFLDIDYDYQRASQNLDERSRSGFELDNFEHNHDDEQGRKHEVADDGEQIERAREEAAVNALAVR